MTATIRVCAELVKNKFGTKVECGRPMPPSGSCLNYSLHLSKYRTGFCGTGSCEGTIRKSPSGKALPTCVYWQICSCSCHEVFDRMFTLAEQTRISVDYSGYLADHGDYVLPTFEDIVREQQNSSLEPEEILHIIESPAPDIVPATVARPFLPTQTGRSSRGELEAWVKEVCDAWLIDQNGNPCTPVYVAEEIGHKYGIRNPSTGAIDAVWRRWIRIGFAVIDSKPNRFTAYTEAGIKYTLEGLKERARRASKSGAR